MLPLVNSRFVEMVAFVDCSLSLSLAKRQNQHTEADDTTIDDILTC
jgi:hypothetical protein